MMLMMMISSLTGVNVLHAHGAVGSDDETVGLEALLWSGDIVECADVDVF